MAHWLRRWMFILNNIWLIWDKFRLNPVWFCELEIRVERSIQFVNVRYKRSINRWVNRRRFLSVKSLTKTIKSGGGGGGAKKEKQKTADRRSRQCLIEFHWIEIRLSGVDYRGVAQSSELTWRKLIQWIKSD